ncbi:protein YgfX [Aurantivibrio infirmus]
MHAVAITLVWFSSLPLWFCVLVDLLIICHGLYLLRKHSAVGACALVFFEGAWSMLAQDKKIPLNLVGEAFVSTFLIILHFKTEQGNLICLHFLNDNTSNDDLRKLRVCLNHA